MLLLLKRFGLNMSGFHVDKQYHSPLMPKVGLARAQRAGGSGQARHICARGHREDVLALRRP